MIPQLGAAFAYAVDLSRTGGNRASDIRLNGTAIDPAKRYRVALNDYLAAGGDGLTAFTAGTRIIDSGIIDLDALIAWIAPGRTPPTANRIRILDWSPASSERQLIPLRHCRIQRRVSAAAARRSS